MDDASTPEVRTRRSRTRIVATALAVGLTAVLVTSCGGGGDDSGASVAPAAAPANGTPGETRYSDSDGGGGAAGDSAGSPELASPEDKSATSATGATGGAQPAGLLGVSPMTAQRVRTADLQVQVSDVGGSAAKIRAAAVRLGGSVASEDSRSADQGGGVAQDVMVVRVPEPKLEEAISAATATGKEISRTSSSEDVTATLADLTSREASQRASVDRVRDLMKEATTLQDIVLLEAELSRRETDLEAAQASRRALSDQAAQATLTITLTTSGTPVKQEKEDETGFMAGLHNGWDALLGSTSVLLTFLGAILPIAVVLLVAGWPAWIIARRRRTGTKPVAAQP